MFVDQIRYKKSNDCGHGDSDDNALQRLVSNNITWINDQKKKTENWKEFHVILGMLFFLDN